MVHQECAITEDRSALLLSREQWRTLKYAIAIQKSSGTPRSAPLQYLVACQVTCATGLLMAHILVMHHYYGCHDFFFHFIACVCKV